MRVSLVPPSNLVMDFSVFLTEEEWEEHALELSPPCCSSEAYSSDTGLVQTVSIQPRATSACGQQQTPREGYWLHQVASRE